MRSTLAEAQPLPLVRNGVPFVGPEQARPLWDLGGGCVAVTDGEAVVERCTAAAP